MITAVELLQLRQVSIVHDQRQVLRGVENQNVSSMDGSFTRWAGPNMTLSVWMLQFDVCAEDGQSIAV